MEASQKGLIREEPQNLNIFTAMIYGLSQKYGKKLSLAMINFLHDSSVTIFYNKVTVPPNIQGEPSCAPDEIDDCHMVALYVHSILLPGMFDER